jgi:hypothetical protein
VGDSTASAEPLSRAVRVTAIAIGLVSGCGGGYAVFASSNQAGTAILLILSAMFLLIGVQGTSLIRFSTGSNTVELERRKRQIVERALKEATEEPGLERAEGIVEGIAIVEPSLPSLPEAEARLYRRRLQYAIDEMGYFTAEVALSLLNADLHIRDNQGRMIAVEIKYAGPSKRIDTSSAIKSIEWAERSALPMILVTNAQFSQAVHQRATNSEGVKIRLVTWRDRQDDDALRNALSDLFDSIAPRNQGPN